MPTYIVTNKATGAETYRYSNDTPVEWTGMEFATHDHVAEVEVNPDGSIEGSATLIESKITKLAFRNRFTQAEKVAIEIAALDDPAAPMQQRALAAALRANQADIQAAQYVDLNREDTRTGVQTLESVGLIAVGRAEVILDTAPTEQEVYRG
jgi:hypothetical protein